MKDHEPLKTRAVVRKLPDAVEHKIYDLLADRIMPAREVVRRVLLATDELLRVEELAVGACAHFVHDSWLQVDEDGTGNMLAGASLAEERVEGIVTAADGLIAGHLAVGLNAVLKAEEFPTGVAHLDAGLADVDQDGLTHGCNRRWTGVGTRVVGDWRAVTHRVSAA